MSKKFYLFVLAAVLSAGVLTGCGKASESTKGEAKKDESAGAGKVSASTAGAQAKPVKAHTVAEDEKRGIKFSDDKKTLVKYNAKLEDTEYAIPEGVTAIGKKAFDYCTNLTYVAIPEGVTAIGKRAFNKCHALTGVSIPASVTEIGAGAFGECGLTSVTIPEGVTAIGDEAFERCHGLKSVTIPKSVKTIGKKAFLGCPCEESVKKQFPEYR
jgi:hypothetical protein